MYKMNYVIVIFFTIYISNSLAFSACSSPTGAIGSMQYDSAKKDYQYCNDSSTWISMTAFSTPGAACSKAGMINGDKFCNGLNYLSVDSTSSSGGSCTTNFTYKYFSSFMHICMAGQWHVCGDLTTCQAYSSNESACALDSSCYFNATTQLCEDIPGWTPQSEI
jgi:hypothetical protein